MRESLDTSGDIPASAAASPARDDQDLRTWIARVEDLGLLHRITNVVDVDEEMSAIAYLAARTPTSPAVLFERPALAGDEHRAGPNSLWNLIGPSSQRLAITLGLAHDVSEMELVRVLKTRLESGAAPREVPHREAPVFENTLLGEQLSLAAWPFPRHWPRDGGRYCGTADVVITRDPDTGVLNVGTYRMMVQDADHVGLYMSPGKGARAHLEAAWSTGRPLDVVAAFGVHPALMLAGSQSFAMARSELDVLGGIFGAPLLTTPATRSDLPIPAYAEFAIEARFHPGRMMLEGPFGEFTGYYGRDAAPSPTGEVIAIHHRDRPVLTNALMGDYPSNEQELFYALARAARIWSDLESAGARGVAGVYSHPAAASGLGLTIVAIDQQFPGHSEQILHLAAHVPGGAYFTKWVIVVDHDIDPSNLGQVLWAMSTRCSPADRITLLRDTWNTALDPSINPPEARPYGSRALINACMDHRYLHNYSPRTLLDREVYERVRERWDELGLDAEVPAISEFEPGSTTAP